MAETVSLTRKYVFSSAHRLFIKNLSEEENYRIFQKCANPNGHGHNYSVEVTVSGSICRETGRVIDPELLDSYMHSIINELDHKRLEKDVGYFHKRQSTGENIAVFIFNELKNTGELNVTKIRIWENKNSYFEHIKEEDQ